MREYTVFNISQTQNVDLPPPEDVPDSEASLDADLVNRLLGALAELPAVSWGHN